MMLYRFDVTRTKSQFTASLGKIRHEMLKISKLCANCNQPFDDRALDVEHDIPVVLGGSVFNTCNLRLWCKRCHLEKTLIDKRVIQALKGMKVLMTTRFECVSVIPINELIALYRTLWAATKTGREHELHFWDNHSYEHFTENRGTKDGRPAGD